VPNQCNCAKSTGEKVTALSIYIQLLLFETLFVKLEMSLVLTLLSQLLLMAESLLDQLSYFPLLPEL
jgi:hypothetical protein